MLISRCDVSLSSASGDNPLTKMAKVSKERAEDRGAWRMSDKDYAFC